MSQMFRGVLPSLVFSTMILVLPNGARANMPNISITPGSVCTAQDPNFKGYAYAEHVPLCQRNVSVEEKLQISQAYGVSRDQWPGVEFDHLIPLCAGGSDSVSNVWPEDLADAHKKDVVEDAVCSAMRKGTMTQQQAIQEIYQWLRENPS